MARMHVGFTIIIWLVPMSGIDAQKATLVDTISAGRDGGESIALSPDGNLLAYGTGFERSVMLWDCRSKSHVRTLREHQSQVLSVAFSADGKFLVSASGYVSKSGVQEGVGELFIWDAKTGVRLSTVTSGEYDFHRVGLSSDNQSIIASCRGNVIRVWDIRSKSVVATITGNTFAVSPNGGIAVEIDAKGTLGVFDKQFRQIGSHRVSSDRICSLAFSPSGATLAVACVDDVIRLWDVKMAKVVGVLEGHSGMIKSISYSKDERMLASASSDKSVCVWNLKTLSRQYRITGHSERVFGVCFMPSGSELASSSVDRTVKIWRLDK